MKALMPLLFILLFSDACVDRLGVNSYGPDLGILVVDGVITDQPGPYTVRLLLSSEVHDVLNNPKRAPVKQVTILDDAGSIEVLKSTGEVGVYQTDPDGMRGEIGRSYAVRIELIDGTLFESVPEEMKAVSEIDSLYFEWESFQPIAGPTQYGFRIFLDSKENQERVDNYLRWRFSGSYVVRSYPELNKFGNNCEKPPPPPDPLPCSGFVYTGRTPFDPGFLKKESECTCCFCWVSDFENKPSLSDEVIVTNGTYKKIEVGYIPFNQWTFGQRKYMVKVEQMSLSKTAFDFWKIIRDQKEGATSLFQPSFGKATTNLYSVNSDQPVLGFFYATSIQKKIIYLTGADAPISIPAFDIEPPEDNCALWRSCTEVFVNASTSPPKDWD